MATTAFGSSTRRSTGWAAPSSTKTSSSPKRAAPRRSRSVSAFPRTHFDVSTEFSNKRDNPLFWSCNSPMDAESLSTSAKSDDAKPRTSGGSSSSRLAGSKFGAQNAKGAGATGGVDRQGRSASRGGPPSVSRSLSRVGTGRRGRSVSRGPASRGQYVTSESEAEQERGTLVSHRTRSDSIIARSMRNKSDVLDQIGSTQTWSSQPRGFDVLDDSASTSLGQAPNWEDGISTSSFSGAEEKTIKAVSEQMKPAKVDFLGLGGGSTGSDIYETVRSEVRRAISDIRNDLESAVQRSNTKAIMTGNINDISPELVNPGAVELVLDIRNDYAKKLQQSQERARKLRADLAVEEHRGQELARILKEILPNPMTPNVQKPRPRRKDSIDRRKMSKRLEEEAMSYFDECVSISTFDSSDFSSQEDPPLRMVGSTTPVMDSKCLPQGSTVVSATCCPSSCLHDKKDKDIQDQYKYDDHASALSANRSNKESTSVQVSDASCAEQCCKYEISFAHKPSEDFEIHKDLRKYVRNFEKNTRRGDINSQRSRHYNVDGYSLQASAEGLLFDRVLFRSRIESGSLLLCNEGFLMSFSPFGPI